MKVNKNIFRDLCQMKKCKKNFQKRNKDIRYRLLIGKMKIMENLNQERMKRTIILKMNLL
jgi:hypothetical protein